MPDFSKSRPGDPCWSIEAGDTYIKRVDLTSGYPIQTEVGYVYTMDGKRLPDNVAPSLFHSRPEWTDPPPPITQRVTVLRRLHVVSVYESQGDPEDFPNGFVQVTMSSAPCPPNCLAHKDVEIEFEIRR